MKLLMESWRNFINESWTKEYKMETLGLYTFQTSAGINLALVDLASAQPPETPMVIGMIETSTMTDKPCIPDTHEIGAVAVHPSALERGIGTYLYEVASLLVLKNYNGGITSDHLSSTTKPAAKVWNKLENEFGYIKRKTAPGTEEYNEDGEIIGGSDTFDYNGTTPDPNDDCDDLDAYKAASDHSLQIPPERISSVQAIMMKQINNLNDYLDKSDISVNLIRREMTKQANKLFNDEYKPEKTGIHGDKK